MNISADNFLVIQGWMRTELGLTGNNLMLYAIIYGFSQDGQTRFTGSQQYLADWCGCTRRSVQNGLKELEAQDLIEKFTIDRNGVKFCEYAVVIPNNTETTTDAQISEGTKNFRNPYEKISHNNIENKKEENTRINSSRAAQSSFLGSAKKQQSKPNLYNKCIALIDEFTQESKLRDLLVRYLNLRLEMKDSPMYVNQWKGLLNKLSDVIADNPGMSYEDVVQQSIDRGYKSFFPVNTTSYKKKDNFSEGSGLSCSQATEDDLKSQHEFEEELREKGLQATF